MATRKMTIHLNKCERCGYEWPQRKQGGVPVRCAKCRSKYWNIPKKGEK